MYNFEATIQKVPDRDGTYIEIPFDVEKEFGAKRVKVKAKFDGVEYRGSIVNMGQGCHIIGMTKDIRKEIGKNVKLRHVPEVLIELDTTLDKASHLESLFRKIKENDSNDN